VFFVSPFTSQYNRLLDIKIIMLYGAISKHDGRKDKKVSWGETRFIQPCFSSSYYVILLQN